MKLVLELILCSFLSFFAGCSSFQKNSADIADMVSIVENFHRSTCRGNLPQTESLISALENIPLEEFRRQQAECVSKGGFKSFEVLSATQKDEMMFIEGKVIFNDNSIAPVDVRLFRENNVWKITSETVKSFDTLSN